MSTKDWRNEVALFRLAVLGDLVHTELARGALRRALRKKSQVLWLRPDGKTRRIASKTIQAWYYCHREHGFDGLLPKERRDKGTCRAIPQELQDLIVEMKREDAGRSIPMIIRELEGRGVAHKQQLRESVLTQVIEKRASERRRLATTPASSRAEMTHGQAIFG